MMTFRFVQVSDLHLGSAMTSSALRLPASTASTRRKELRDVLQRVCELVEHENADALLIPGDLFDDESVSFEEVGYVIDQFKRVNRPVISPGNHDYVSPASYYNDDFLRSRHGVTWPSNVYVFQRQSWKSLHIRDLPGICFTGIGFQTHVQIEHCLLSDVRCSPDELQVLLFHGSRQRFAPVGKVMTLPFTDEELIASGCDYAAIGHYHTADTVEHAGRIVGAYSGCPAGRGLDECGQKVVLMGEISDDRSVKLGQVVVDPRRILRLEIDCTGIASDVGALRQVDESVRASGARSADIVHVSLTGRMPPSVTIQVPQDFLADRFFHICVDTSQLGVGYDLDRYREDDPSAYTTEGRFVRRLLADLDSARETGDSERVKLIQQAIEYGLDALTGVRIQPRAAP